MTYPLHPHQRKVVEDLKRATPERFIALEPPLRSAAIEAAGASLREAIAALPNPNRPSRLYRPGEKPTQPVAQHLIVEPSPAVLLAALDGKTATVQRLQADFARMFGKKP